MIVCIEGVDAAGKYTQAKRLEAQGAKLFSFPRYGTEVGELIRAHLTGKWAVQRILLDVDAETSFERRPDRRDQYERDLEGLKRRAEAYRKLWRNRRHADLLMGRAADPRWQVVDGRAPLEQVSAEVDNVVRLAKEIENA